MIAKFYDIIRSPKLSEKTCYFMDSVNRYTFNILKDANKAQVKKAVEHIYDVKVEKVNIINCKGKNVVFKGTKGKKSSSKKAIVKLVKDNKIDFNEIK